jgi:hypothetical protein
MASAKMAASRYGSAPCANRGQVFLPIANHVDITPKCYPIRIPISLAIRVFDIMYTCITRTIEYMLSTYSHTRMYIYNIYIYIYIHAYIYIYIYMVKKNLATEEWPEGCCCFAIFFYLQIWTPLSLKRRDPSIHFFSIFFGCDFFRS